MLLPLWCCGPVAFRRGPLPKRACKRAFLPAWVTASQAQPEARRRRRGRRRRRSVVVAPLGGA